jgi:hypothetical protein
MLTQLDKIWKTKWVHLTFIGKNYYQQPIGYLDSSIYIGTEMFCNHMFSMIPEHAFVCFSFIFLSLYAEYEGSIMIMFIYGAQYRVKLVLKK